MAQQSNQNGQKRQTGGRRLTRKEILILLALCLIVLAVCCYFFAKKQESPGTLTDLPTEEDLIEDGGPTTLEDLPAYTGEPYVVVFDNEPSFTETDMTTESYEFYGELDYLGRCTTTIACVGKDLMPTEKRESISSVRPTGWIQNSYDFVDGRSLYNRCHLIGFQLTGENANKLNLITGTRYLNVDGMLPFENMVADYVHETSNHVLYRVTPVFRDEELVARGVQMEALSVEDSGDGVSFNVYCYNVQPGVEIDYATGENWEVGTQ